MMPMTRARWRENETPEQAEKRRAAARRRYTRHSEEIMEWQRAYRAANADKVNAQVRARRAANPEHARGLARARYAANREKINARNKEIRDKSKDRDGELRRRHGMRRDEWDAMWEAQQGCCYLCGDELRMEGPNGNSKAVMDHRHDCCGRKKSCPACRRGIACTRCNIIIGYARDDPERLRRIAVNLEEAMELHGALVPFLAPAAAPSGIELLFGHATHLRKRAMADRELPRESGWYRLTGHGWERVPDADAETEAAADGGWDLVYIHPSAIEVPLW